MTLKDSFSYVPFTCVGSRCSLVMHATLTTLVLTTELVIIGLYFGASNAFGRTTSKFLMNGIWHYGRGDVWNDLMIDDMQQTLKCCSVYNMNEWTMSANRTVPASCCSAYRGENDFECTEDIRWYRPCATAWDRLIRPNVNVIAGVGISLLCLQALSVIASIVFARTLPKGKKYHVSH